jgi:hypothetical protein
MTNEVQGDREDARSKSAFVIGVAGTHSTGKTTFLSELRQEFGERGLRLGRVNDLATAARDAGFGILREHTFESTLWIVTRGISEELAAAIAADVVLVDRPVPDALGYLKAALEHRGDDLSPAQWAYLWSIARGHAPRYDLMFKTVVDPSIPIDTTKERDFDWEYRVRVAASIDSVFDELQLPFHELGRGGGASAVEQCLQAASEYRER